MTFSGNMRVRLLLLTLTLALGGLASEMSLNIDQLGSFIRSSINLKLPDKQVASYLHDVHLTQKLDDRTIEDYQSMGAGPKTLEALRRLRDASASLAVAPPPVEEVKPAPIPGPDSVEQKKILDAVREYALGYSKQLPNFICMQVTRRYYDPHGQDDWRQQDQINARLSFFDQKEDYKVVSVNNHYTDIPMEKLGGTISEGEFGSEMKQIFEPETGADFSWDHWATLRGKRTYVFAYRIAQANSKYRVDYENGTADVVPGYHGLIYVDKDTNMVVRITLIPDLPATFPIQHIHTTLDYNLAQIGDSEYMLPLRAEILSNLPRYSTKNDVEFRLYRKFGAETSIHFDTDAPAPLPDDQTKEKPAAPAQKP
ncbi:MAG TPA: hypothetical protein VN610_11850 [Bryobacteraceae bacterium]|nr:hypothetical protein [Bryobacteraceae bacterium]